MPPTAALVGGLSLRPRDRASCYEEMTDDLVRDMIEVLTSMCARLYGRRGARNRAVRAVTATRQDPGGQAA